MPGNSPSAFDDLARRSRSASAWAAIDRLIDSGSSTDLISTMLTLMPHWIGLLVDDLLKHLVQLFALGEQLIKFGLAQNVSKSGLGYQGSGADVIEDP